MECPYCKHTFNPHVLKLVQILDDLSGEDSWMIELPEIYKLLSRIQQLLERK